MRTEPELAGETCSLPRRTAPSARHPQGQVRTDSRSVTRITVHEIDQRLADVSRHAFRARFHLRGRDRAIVELRGMHTIRRHAQDLIGQRLAPAAPRNDGKQTPYRGHPVFVAQHATATCCRTCLERWHQIPRGHQLDTAERGYVVDLICRWIELEFAPAQPPL